ncbi:hypothetical protein HY994_00095 [Candidatus Micrarchaeota archaeon]|nr:hypothetical protein [Candidatus Micrarchaeota archaeon]
MTYDLDKKKVSEVVVDVTKTKTESKVQTTGTQTSNRQSSTQTSTREDGVNRYVIRYGNLDTASGYLDSNLVNALKRIGYSANEVVTLSATSGKRTLKNTQTRDSETKTVQNPAKDGAEGQQSEFQFSEEGATGSPIFESFKKKRAGFYSLADGKSKPAIPDDNQPCPTIRIVVPCTRQR